MQSLDYLRSDITMGVALPRSGSSRGLSSLHSKRIGQQAGTSILEVIIATLILGLAAVGFVEFFAYGRVLFDNEEHKRVATLLAQDAVERTVHTGYDQIADWNTNRTIASIPYTVSVTVEAETPEANMKTVHSVVTWPISATGRRSISVATIVDRQ